MLVSCLVEVGAKGSGALHCAGLLVAPLKRSGLALQLQPQMVGWKWGVGHLASRASKSNKLRVLLSKPRSIDRHRHCGCGLDPSYPNTNGMEITIIFLFRQTVTDTKAGQFPQPAAAVHRGTNRPRGARRLPASGMFVLPPSFRAPAALADGAMTQFYNAVLFLGSVAVFSLVAQRMNAAH